jgi:putative oxygen-independent coproporphyrinogen III oxidase
MENWRTGGFGLYVHWPFCQAKCPYCDFNSHVSAKVDQAAWARGFLWNLERLAAETGDRMLETIYFGGGTPSLMDPALVGAILDKVQRLWRCVNDLEITLEANPTSVEAGRFRGYRAAGVNRVSLGVQALDNVGLRALGRLHSVDDALRAVALAQETFDRVSFDLIYARQNQTVANWEAELARALALGTDHLSLYQLTVEDGTAFAARHAAGGLLGLPDEDRSVALFEMTQTLCEAEGLPGYEISNHARMGQESRHNLIYWRGGDYLGVGPGAHGRLSSADVVWATEEKRMPSEWLDDVSRETSPELPRAALTLQDRSDEVLMMGLRLREGLELTKVDALRDQAISRVKVSAMVETGLVTFESGILRTTARGRLVLNAVLRELLID